MNDACLENTETNGELCNMNIQDTKETERTITESREGTELMDRVNPYWGGKS